MPDPLPSIMDTVGLSRRIGMYGLPGLASAYPDLATKLAAIYRDGIARLPWVPSTWAADVAQLHNVAGNVLLPMPTLTAAGQPQKNLPAWLDTAEKVKTWNDIANVARAAVQSYSAQKLAEGRATLDAALRNAAFWDAAYNLANALAAPVRAARSAVSILSGTPGWMLLAAAGVGVALLFRSRK